MGEYAYVKGTNERIRIGTCESLSDLRFDQLDQIEARDRHDTDPRTALSEFLFRFPWPDEDHIAPGMFRSERSVPLGGVEIPEIKHYKVQFASTHPKGFLLSLPCPESPEGKALPLDIARNGYAGAVRIVMQRVWEGRLVTVCECGGCGAMYRLPTFEDAEPLVAALRSRAEGMERQGAGAGAFHAKVADRIVAGYERIIEGAAK